MYSNKNPQIFVHLGYIFSKNLEISEFMCIIIILASLYPDGLDMYPTNPLNPAIYPEDKTYMCGNWLVEYEKLHNGAVLIVCVCVCVRERELRRVHNMTQSLALHNCNIAPGCFCNQHRRGQT